LVHARKYRTEDKLNTDNTETKHNSEKPNNTKHSKIKLAWFSHFLQHSARKRGELILQCFDSQANTHGLDFGETERCMPNNDDDDEGNIIAVQIIFFEGQHAHIVTKGKQC